MEKANKIAKAISFIFSPIFTGAGAIVLLAKLSPAANQWLKALGISFFLVFIVPFIYFLILLKQKKISDWDISQRRERYKIYTFVFLILLFCLMVFYFLFGKASVVFYLKMLLPFFIFFLITFFYKVSGHLFVNSFFILLLYFYSNNSIIIFMGIFLLILIAWSRIVLKKHTLGQVILGGFLPALNLLINKAI